MSLCITLCKDFSPNISGKTQKIHFNKTLILLVFYKQKSHCCVGSDAEEPLRGAQKESLETGELGKNHLQDDHYKPLQQRHSHSPLPSGDEEGQQSSLPSQNRVEPEIVDGPRTRSKFWRLFHCTNSGDDDSHSGNGTKR